MRMEFLRHASWLDAGRLRGYMLLLALLNAATLAALLITSRNGLDYNGSLLGTDFLSFWTAGQMLHHQGNVYDTAAHIAAQRGYFASVEGYTAFFYPPQFLLLCYPLGFLPYFPALALWLGATGAVWLLAVREWFRRLGLTSWLAIAAFPPVLISILHGQSSFLAAALLGLGALAVRGRPVLAGALFGLAAFKPQFGLLIPLVLLVTGEWRTIFAAAATLAILAALTALTFGPDVWSDWLAASAKAQSAMDSGVIGFAKMQSPFAAAKLLGASSAIALAIQLVVGFGIAAALVWAGWRRRYSMALAAATLAGAPLVTPFVLDYDLVLLAFPLAWLATRDFRAWEKIVCFAVFVAPAFARPLAVSIGVPIMVPLLIALFVLLIRRAREAEVCH